MPKKLGQHFLKNTAVLEKIADGACAKPGMVVIEIGPGHGELTEHLLVRNPKKLFLIEKDKNFAAILAEKFKGREKISVIAGDALDVLKGIILGREIGNGPYVLAGNLPYYITGHLLREVGDFEHKPERCVFMLQKEVAERIVAAPPDMNRLAASVQFWSRAEIVARAPKKYFSPPPKMDSAAIMLSALTQKPCVAAQHYYAAMRSLFAQPRKTIINNLESSQGNNGLSKAEIGICLSKIGINPSSRPQDLSIENIQSIARALFLH